MQGRQHQMAREARLHRDLRGFEIADFANHDDIRVLAQNVPERGMKGEGVEADFALFDDGLIVLEDVFNRVFESRIVKTFQADSA